jgi:hypothetical protein
MQGSFSVLMHGVNGVEYCLVVTIIFVFDYFALF